MSLSQRAEALSHPDPNFITSDVIQNLWHPQTRPDGWVSLGIAENTLLHDVLLKHMHEHMSIPRECLTYGDGFTRLKAAHAHFLNRHLKPATPILPAHVITSNGLTTALENLAWAFANPGDAILFGRPHYGAFPTDLGRRTQSSLSRVSFGGIDPMGMDAVGKYEEKILEGQNNGEKVVAILLAHPHNPLGRCFPREVLIEFMKLCQKYQVHLISDEIYALSTFENTVDTDTELTRFQSLLSIDPTGIIDPSLVHVLWGMSKDFGANGIRMGCTITQHNAPLRTALGSVAEFCWTSSLSDFVTANILEDDEFTDKYIKQNQANLGKHHHEVASWARKNNIEYTRGATAGFFVWANLGAIYQKNHPVEDADLDKALWKALVQQKIFLADGVRSGAEQPGWMRIVFSQPLYEVEEGLRRILLAIS